MHLCWGSEREKTRFWKRRRGFLALRSTYNSIILHRHIIWQKLCKPQRASFHLEKIITYFGWINKAICFGRSYYTHFIEEPLSSSEWLNVTWSTAQCLLDLEADVKVRAVLLYFFLSLFLQKAQSGITNLSSLQPCISLSEISNRAKVTYWAL